MEGLSTALVQGQDDPVVLRQVEARQPLTGTLHELWSRLEEERHVRADARRELSQRRLDEWLRKRLVCEPEGGGGVGASAPETCGYGDCLAEADVPAGRDARRGRQREKRVAHDRVLREAGDAELGGFLESHAIGEIDALHRARELVQAVGPERSHDERQVDLRRRSLQRAPHRSSSASAG